MNKHTKITLQELIRLARAQYGSEPTFTVQIIVVSGILQWNYEVQVCVEQQHLWEGTDGTPSERRNGTPSKYP